MASVIKDLRLQKGITQAELAKAIQVSPSAIGMYEQGRRNPDIETYRMLATFFDVSLDYITNANGDPQPPSKHENKQAAIDETIAMYEQLSPEDKEKVKSYIQFVASQNI